MGPCAAASGSLFDSSGAGADSTDSVLEAIDAGAWIGRGRGNGGDAVWLWTAAVPVRRLNLVETSCAISDKGERASGRPDDSACAWIDVVVSVKKSTQNVGVFNPISCTIPSVPDNRATLRHDPPRNEQKALH